MQLVTFACWQFVHASGGREEEVWALPAAAVVELAEDFCGCSCTKVHSKQPAICRPALVGCARDLTEFTDRATLRVKTGENNSPFCPMADGFALPQILSQNEENPLNKPKGQSPQLGVLAEGNRKITLVRGTLHAFSRG